MEPVGERVAEGDGLPTGQRDALGVCGEVSAEVSPGDVPKAILCLAQGHCTFLGEKREAQP